MHPLRFQDDLRAVTSCFIRKLCTQFIDVRVLFHPISLTKATRKTHGEN